MFKKLTYGFLLIFVVIAFTHCYQDHFYLPANTRPVFKKGDTLIYTSDTNIKDTFQVTLFYYYMIEDGPYSIENMNYKIKD